MCFLRPMLLLLAMIMSPSSYVMSFLHSDVTKNLCFMMWCRSIVLIHHYVILFNHYTTSSLYNLTIILSNSTNFSPIRKITIYNSRNVLIYSNIVILFHHYTISSLYHLTIILLDYYTISSLYYFIIMLFHHFYYLIIMLFDHYAIQFN